MKKGLSARQQSIYRFLQTYIQEHGVPPTYREIGAALGMKTTSHVDYLLGQLEQQGLIERESGKARTIRPAQVGLVVQGRIAAGQPLEIFDTAGPFLDLTRHASQGRAYILQVTGTSMIEEHIEDGDYVLIDPDAPIEQGDIIVACERGEAASERGAITLKRLYKWPGHIELRPANSSMVSRFIPAQEWDRNWAIQGKVKAIYRLFDRT